MRKIYITLAAICPLLLQAAPLATSEMAGHRTEGHQLILGAKPASAYRANGRITVAEIFAAPEGTVLDGPFKEDAAYTGSQGSDQGRPGMPTIFFQAFHGCTKTVNEIRFIGEFQTYDSSDYNWYPCDTRGGMNEDYDLTEPIKFEVGFYRADDNGLPGEEVYKRQFDIVGRNLGVTTGFGPYETPLYEFRVKLGEDIRLESGFCAFSAVDTGDAESCWFSVFTASSSMDYGYLYDMLTQKYERAMLPSIFSFMGDGSWAAKKALRVDNISSPSVSGGGSHEKVTVKVINVGSETITDAALELWIDGKGITTEKLPVDLAPGASFNYTFNKRADLSVPGEHVVEVRNATPGDEKISIAKCHVNTVTLAEGEGCQSDAYYEDERVSLQRVKFGTVDNESGVATYTDFFNAEGCMTDIRLGETLTLTREPEGRYLTGVWVDWNGDGMFDGPGEEVGYLSTSVGSEVQIKIPEGISVDAGPKRLRIIVDAWNNPQPCGIHNYGETEDYALNVVRNDNTPSLTVDLSELSSESFDNEHKQTSFVLGNVGDALLNATAKIHYTLSDVYEPRQMAPASSFKSSVKARKSAALSADAAAPAGVAHVLKYDGGHENAVSLGNYASAIFGSYWPATKLIPLKGMEISSVDVYIETAPESAKIKIFGAGANASESGELLVEQPFEITPKAWNTITLATPLKITGEDLWIGVEMSGMSTTEYHIGIDGIPAISGYGDVCNIGGNHWWSMSELGIDHNFCVRANVSGQISPYLNWLTLDNDNFSVEPGKSSTVKATMNPENLAVGTYEATIEIRTNDELHQVHNIPVYFANGVLSSIDATHVNKASVRFTAEGIVLSGEEAIASVVVADLAGHTVISETVGTSHAAIPVDNLANGVYVLAVTYVDGTVETAKVALTR